MDYYDLGYALGSSISAASMVVSMLISLAVTVVIVIGQWKVYEKAGEPGWAAIVPFYSQYVLFKITFGNGWLFLLMFVPCVNFVIMIIAWFKLATAFGKGTGFGFGLWLLNAIFICILGFGDATYVGINKSNN